MSNLFENLSILDLQGSGFGQEMIFVKDHLLYIPGMNAVRPKDVKTAESLLFKRLISQEWPAILTPNYPEREEDVKPKAEAAKPVTAKTSFLVFKHQKYTTVQTENIAYFYVRNDSVSLMGFDQEEYTLNQSLDQITNSVSDSQFFRVNRKYLINFKAIKEVEHYFMRKLFVKLTVETPDKLLIHKEKTNIFLSWMSDR
ncbi:LytTR family transcriptional regulator [Mucilaginibacter conchicola]|uniref:LytTR family transcriptional regulator n=1 Tax=Mucilaginibacter conchicola TaxID=2303333 RepID=A0A372NM61_9SPHI|nr:LytTR family DNA-binding domain-containing protein [Mucilaginibacter conchicola]RFZ90039.1 LytTR family transcriptional regulator [Mucilaginibacter conchicola]